METPAHPLDEAERLDALWTLGLLDTPPEARFDRLTRLACRVFGAETALVSLVDDERQWFKSRVGFAARELPRCTSFCGHAILGDGVFWIPDTLRDARFADNPLVRGEPFIRFYAGCPIRSAGGYKLGTLCVLDTEPREFTPEQEQDLRDLAAIAERELHAVELAITDELTGLSNRRGFLALAGQSLRICRRERLPAALIYFDLDGFKAINDADGHAAGDAVLRCFAGHLQSEMRASDPCGRVGGDEFVAFLAGADGRRSERVTARLRDRLAAAGASGEMPASIRFSFGIVAFDPERHASVDDLVGEADYLMYRDKFASA